METNANSVATGKEIILVGKDDKVLVPAEYRDRASAIAGGLVLDPGNTTAIIAYGTEAQKGVADFADTVMAQVKAGDVGQAGGLISQLMVTCKSINVKEMVAAAQGKEEKKGPLAKITSLFSGAVGDAKKVLAKYESLGEQIQVITDKLVEAQAVILRDVATLDQLYQHNLASFHELECYIYALGIKIEELKGRIVIARQEAETGGQLKAQEVQDLTALLDRCERKLHDLQLTRTIALQTLPQIRLIQNGDTALAEKIQSSILSTIPIWKNQLVIAITLMRQAGAAKLQAEVSDTTNSLLGANADLLQMGTVAIAKESERGIVDIETLTATNQKFLATLDEVQKIREDGKTKRALAEKEMKKIEADLKAKLLHQ